MHIMRYFARVSEEYCIYSHCTVAQKRSRKPRQCVCRHVGAKPARGSAVLCRAVPGCTSVLPRRTSAGAWGRGARGLGRGRRSFVCTFTAGLGRAMSVWVRAQGAAPAAAGQVTARGCTWTWPLHCTAPGTKPTCVGHVPSCVTLWLSAAVVRSWGVTQ